MGLLDDAIREHLELKRRHGADAAEVSELEREAFGPAREAPAPLAPSEPGRPQGAGDPALAEPLGDPPEPDARAFSLDEREAARRAPEPEPDDSEDDDDFGEPTRQLAAEPPRRATPAPLAWDEPISRTDPEPEPEPHPEDVLGGETRAFDPEELAEAQDRPAQNEVPAEDLLEETPEFLQETPEHDRLWFEQRPPRDFDFDK
jgi:hypothetical protein